jgi:hypothetical protein
MTSIDVLAPGVYPIDVEPAAATEVDVVPGATIVIDVVGVNGPPGPQGPQGIQGPQGVQGPAGPAAVSTRAIQMTVSGLVNTLTAGTGKAFTYIPAFMAGWRVTAATGQIEVTPSSSGLVTVQFTNVTQAAAILSTPLTIDANEMSSATAATPPVIDTGHNTVQADDQIRVDVSTAGTGTLGLLVTLTLTAP